jgi:hypothetical protein
VLGRLTQPVQHRIRVDLEHPCSGADAHWPAGCVVPSTRDSHSPDGDTRASRYRRYGGYPDLRVP